MKIKIISLVIFSIALVNQAAGQNSGLLKGCVGQYLFNNNILDSSPLKKQGTAYGGSFTIDRNGNLNSAYHFNGKGEYIQVDRPFTGSFTVCFWVRTMQAGYNAENGAFYGSTGMVDNECIGCGGDFGVDLLEDKAVFGIDEYQLPSTRYINSGQWIHIAAVRDSVKAKMFLYLNAELDTLLNAPDYIPVENQPDIYFGKLHGANEDEKPYFDGDLDDIYFFNRALSSGEIFELAFGNINPAQLFRFNGSVAEINKPIVLRDIQFDQNKSDLRLKAKQELDKLAAWLKENPNVTIELSGHTSNDGGMDANYKLSIARAESCKKYLTGKGISEGRIVSKGYGFDNPAVSNETEEGRKANRRVEFKIISK